VVGGAGIPVPERAGQGASTRADQRITTVNLDATLIDSHKQQALRTFEGGRGCQSMLAVAKRTTAAPPGTVTLSTI
jgi:hypothetical protein